SAAFVLSCWLVWILGRRQRCRGTIRVARSLRSDLRFQRHFAALVERLREFLDVRDVVLREHASSYFRLRWNERSPTHGTCIPASGIALPASSPYGRVHYCGRRIVC